MLRSVKASNRPKGRSHTIREESPQHIVLRPILTAWQRTVAALVPARVPHHCTPDIAHRYCSVFSNEPDCFGILGSRLCGTSQAVKVGDVATVVSPQHPLVDRRRGDEDDSEVGTSSDVRMREDGVEVSGEGLERDVLLRATWSVGEAGVVGAYE